MLLFHVGGFLLLYALLRLQALTAAQPRRHVGGAARPLVQHGGELHHQHQLAELRRRKHDVLSDADAGPDAAELRRRRRPASRWRWRSSAASRARRRRPIGNFWVDLTRCTLYVLLPICIVYALFLVWQGMPQTLGAYVEATTLEGAKQTHRGGPGGVAGRHQDARHQWRRLLQRQRRASVREPDALSQLRADGLDLRASARR